MVSHGHIAQIKAKFLSKYLSLQALQYCRKLNDLLGFFPMNTLNYKYIYIFSSQTSTSNANFHYKIKLLKISFWIKCLSTYSWVWLMICKELYNFWKEKQKQLNVKIKFLTSKKDFHRVGVFFT